MEASTSHQRVGLAEEQRAQLLGLGNLHRGLGEVAMFLAGHAAYKGMFLSDLRRSVLPAVLHNQYRIIRNRQERTVGYVSWAMVNEEVHKRLIGGRLKLQLEDWISGDLAVVMDVASATASSGERILRELKVGLFPKEDLWLIRTDAGMHDPKLAKYRLREVSGSG